MAKKRKKNRRTNKRRPENLDFMKPHPVFSKMTTEELKAVDLDAFAQEDRGQWKLEILQRHDPLAPEFHHFLDFEGQFGPILKHPLYVGSVDPDRAAFVNWVISYKQQVIKGLMAEGKWRDVVFGHEQMFYDDAFRQYLKHFDDSNYWEILSIIWTQQEQLWPNREWFLQLFQSQRPEREHLMSADEHGTLAQLPDEFPIYRGFIGKRGEGLSWSLSREKAEWFARRFSLITQLGKPQLMVGVVNKRDVLAYFDAREEQEIVVDPANVRSMEVESVPPSENDESDEDD
jgi:hypothetical protein